MGQNLYVGEAAFVTKQPNGMKGGRLFVEAETEEGALDVAKIVLTILSEHSPVEYRLNLDAIEVRKAHQMEMFLAAATDAYVSAKRLELVRSGEAEMKIATLGRGAKAQPLVLTAEMLKGVEGATNDDILDADLLM